MKLTRIGYWASARSTDWPDPARFIDLSWDALEREAVAEYLSHGLIARRYLGPSMCRMCGGRNGSLELTDGVFIWPEGLAHYVEEHGVRPPAKITRHIRRTNNTIDSAIVDESWWRGLGQPWQS